MNKTERLTAIVHLSTAIRLLASGWSNRALLEARAAVAALGPKCPDEPKPAEPECDRDHNHIKLLMPGYRYCPRCGVALTKEGT